MGSFCFTKIMAIVKVWTDDNIKPINIEKRPNRQKINYFPFLFAIISTSDKKNGG